MKNVVSPTTIRENKKSAKNLWGSGSGRNVCRNV